MEATNQESSIVSLNSFKEARIESHRRIGAAMNHVSLAITDLKKFSDIPGVKVAIESLTSLHRDLRDRFESTEP